LLFSGEEEEGGVRNLDQADKDADDGWTGSGGKAAEKEQVEEEGQARGGPRLCARRGSTYASTK